MTLFIIQMLLCTSFFLGSFECRVASGPISGGLWPSSGSGTWTRWSAWSPCSRTCRQGIRTRRRWCQNFSISKLKASCVGLSFQLSTCTGKKPCREEFLSAKELLAAIEVNDVLDTARKFECRTEASHKSKYIKGAYGTQNKWTNKEVPYVLDATLTDDDRAVFAKAICEISMQTCVKFKARDSESKYLKVERKCNCGQTGGGCFGGAFTDGLGASSPRRLVISSACLTPTSTSDVGLMIHELLHALGVEHTQTRPDRDAYITVNNANIEPSKQSQYSKCSSCSTYDTPYDCDSIMHYLDSFFQISGAGPTMTAVCPFTCDLKSYNSVLKPADVELVRKMYLCESGTDLYLYIKGIDDGTHCVPTHLLPANNAFKTCSKVDLKKLFNNGGSFKYWTKFGGFGIAEATPFEGCIDNINQQFLATDSMNTGLLKFANIQVPGVVGTGWTGSGTLGTSIWINMMSQCQHPGECDVEFGHWWKFEKALTPSEAKTFAYSHISPEFADSSVAGTPVVLQYMGQLSCVSGYSYGCDSGEEN